MDLNNAQLMMAIGLEYAQATVIALLIFVAGRWLVNRVVALVERLMLARATDETLVKFVCSILQWLGLLFVVIAALSHLGVDTTSLVALVGAAGLAIGSVSWSGQVSEQASG